ncbi:MAG: helix-hairpin-helix domain-containing protein [Lachnospiraceae bacterium]|nr:helix-hairpin-helix domain-containing protein [Lachnospiraceae bacterium]
MSKMSKNIGLFLAGICFLFTGCAQKQEMYLMAENTEEQVTEKEQDVMPLPAETETEEEADCYVYVCGAVAAPGVYRLAPGSRVYEAVEKAGGLLDTAAPFSLNQALEVTDGQMIHILTKEEALQSDNTPDGNGESVEKTESGIVDGKVNLNAATAAELMTLPGIGEAKAGAILSYREEHGSFAKIEELKNISGIKDGVYEKIKDCITVN